MFIFATSNHLRFATVSMTAKTMKPLTKLMTDVPQIQLALRTISNAKRLTFVWNLIGFVMVIMIVVVRKFESIVI